MSRAKPVLATAAVALSLAACQMGGGERQAAEGPAGQTATAAQQTAAAQSVTPEFIQQVQQRLSQRGYDVGPVDGQWGQSTQTAVRSFQRDQGLQQSGQLDTQTLAALGVTGQQPAQTGIRQQSQPYQPTSRRGQQQGMSPDVVRDVQQTLEERGYDVGEVDGIWGPNTRQALTSFQRDQNLRADGRIDDQTLAALGIEEGQQMGQTPQGQTDLQRRQRSQQEQLGEVPEERPQGGDTDEGLGLFEGSPDQPE